MNPKYIAAWVSSVVGCVAFCAPQPASAEEYRHDGFFLSMTLGAGYLSSDWDVSRTRYGQTESGTVSTKGTGVIGGIFLGGTPLPGLVVGGTSMGNVFSGATMSGPGGSVTLDSDVSINVWLFGPFVQYYFDPDKGLHVGGSVGYSSLSISEGNWTSDRASGWGLAGWVGCEWWVGPEWSLGVAGRLTLASVSDRSGSDKLDITAWIPGVLFTATYH